MNIQSSCQDMCAKLGFGCVQLEDDYPPMMALQTPFGFYGGDPFEIYAEYLGDREQIRFFDSGGRCSTASPARSIRFICGTIRW
jgi:hypothetical protein